MRCTPSICNSRERHNALNLCCLAKYHSLQIDGGFLNGTESRVLLPLWKWETEGRCRTGPVERIHGESDIRNGTESRVLLPLWKAGFAAVVEKGDGGKMPHRGCREDTWGKRHPQRHRIAGFAAVVERGNGGKMPYRGCREGTWGKRHPQRHRIAGFAAVVERGTEGRCRTGAAERIHGESDIRNGTEPRVLLPLWKGGRIMWPGEAGTNDFVKFFLYHILMMMPTSVLL